jgi:hypothetical protein
MLPTYPENVDDYRSFFSLCFEALYQSVFLSLVVVVVGCLAIAQGDRLKVLQGSNIFSKNHCLWHGFEKSG